jgi:porin
LTGDWLGLRPRLKDQGITFSIDVTQFWFGQGGGVNRPAPPPLEKGGEFAYTGRGDYDMIVDLEKFGGLPKGTLLVRMQHWWGTYGNVSFNTGALPPAIFPDTIPPVLDEPGVPFLTDFLVTQPLSKNWVVFAGKKDVLGGADQDDFAGGNGINQFMNQAFIANPAFLLALPYTSFTTGFVSPREWGSLSMFVYDPQDWTRDFFRSDLFAEGIIVGAEVKLKTNLFDLPGEQHVGGLWKHLDLTNLRFDEPPPGVYPYTAVPGSPTLPDSYTIYYGFDQYFDVSAADSKRGWGLFGRASISDGNPTPIRYFLSLGIGGYSPFAYHRGDRFGIGWYFDGASDEFGPIPRAVLGPRDGTGIEMFYNIQATPWMNITPDFQIIKPDAGGIATTSCIGGIRLNLKF